VSAKGADPVLVCRLANGDQEEAAYRALRRAIFCEEQGLFTGDDRDAIDEVAHPIVCLVDGEVRGVVRVWEEAPGDWWGGRLGVDRDFRSLAAVGRRLIQVAVGSARAWGAWRFRATVQRPNVPFFRRLHWRTVEEISVLGQPHHLMEADLAAYPLTAEVRPEGAQCLGSVHDHAA
jgi:putative N-acetyltransferase (TIGR04045 family)